MKPSQTILLALDKAKNGANVHDIGEFKDYYLSACEAGKDKLAALWEEAFNAFLSGRITPIRKAVAEIRHKGNPPMYGNRNWWNEGK